MTFRRAVHHLAYTEINLDYTQECEYCNYITSVIDRIYGLGSQELNSGFTAIMKGNEAAIQKANDESHAQVVEKYAGHLKWHRCVGCGKYGTKTLALMRQGLPGFRSWRNFARWFWWSFGIICLIIAIGMIADALNPRFEARRDISINIAVVFGILTFIFAYIGNKVFSNIDERFGSLMAKVNSRETVQKWLRDWQEESPGMIDKFYNGDPNGYYDINDPNSQMQYRASYYENIERLQHRYDPIPRDLIPTSVRIMEQASSLNPPAPDSAS